MRHPAAAGLRDGHHMPVLIVFLFGERYFLEGICMTELKG